MARDPKGIFGQILLNLREGEGYSQETLAEASKISRDFVSKLERGLAMPSVKTLEKLGPQFNLTGEQLYHRFILKLKNEGIYEQWIKSKDR